jgi:hypothetical protein
MMLDIVRERTSPEAEKVCAPAAEMPARSHVAEAEYRVPVVSTPENQF